MCNHSESICERLLSLAAIQPDKLCIADESVSLSYTQYKDKICRTAAVLRRYGIEKGSHVVVEASQTVNYLACGLAIQLTGAVFIPVERNCAHTKIDHFAFVSGAKLCVTNKPAENMCCECITMDALSSAAGDSEAYIPTEFPKSGDVCEILFSTGTTGKEKGIVITNSSDIALAQNVIDGVKMEKDNIELIPSPMNHSHGLRRYYANMYNGSTVIISSGVVNLAGFFEIMDKYRVNSIDMVPTALSVMLKLSRGKLGEYKNQLRYIQFGAAPLMQSDKDEIKRLLPNTRLYNFYGSTESGCICIYDFNDGRDKKSCIGKPVVNADIIIVDENRREIQSSPTHTGLLASGGAMNMKEYFLDREETDSVCRDGFIYTNDEAYYDEDGDIILLGRVGDVINVGGCKVSPEEIENIAKKHPMVEDCGCVPVKDAVKGQVPKLFVKAAKGVAFDEKELRSFILSNAEPYKVPKFIVQTDEIPRTYNGKIIRRKLIEQ